MGKYFSAIGKRFEYVYELQMKLVKIFFIVLLAVIATGCGDFPNERNNPIFTVDSKEKPKTLVSIEVMSRIDPTVIQPGVIRTVFSNIVGWIPLLGELLEMPMNLVNTLTPKLPINEIFDLPDDAALNDPEVLSSISSVTLTSAVILITPEKDRVNYKPKKCIIKHFCRDETLKIFGDVAFLIREKAHHGNLTLLARGTQSKNMSADGKSYSLIPEKGIDLKPFIADLDKYEVRVVAKGKMPRNPVYLEGKLYFKVDLLY
jgi:hypothetical protein